MILAEATSAVEPSALIFGIWIGCAFLVINGLVGFATLIKMIRNDSERREVTINPEVLTRREFEEARNIRDSEIVKVLDALKAHMETNRLEHENLFKKIGGVERGARRELDDAKKEDADSRRRLHQDITQLTGAISRLDGKIEGRI